MKLEVVRGAEKEYRDPATGKAYYSHSQVARVIWPDAYSHVRGPVLVAAQLRGKWLHFLFACLLFRELGIEVPHEVPDEYRADYEALQRWISKHQPRPELIEESGKNDKMGVAGTADFKGWLDDDLWLIDLKSGAEEPGPHAFQVNLYSTFDEFKDARKLGVLYVRNGDCELKPVKRNTTAIAVAQNAVGVLRGREIL